MKRKNLTSLLFITAALLIASGCSSAGDTSSEAPSQTAVSETADEAAVSETEAAEADGSIKVDIEKIKGGVWIGTSDDYDRRYYSFYEDPMGGNILFQDSGMGVGFEYEINNGSEAVFHVGDIENANIAEIVSASDDTIELVWDEEEKKVPETLEFYSPDVETFDFTEDEILKEKALNYFEQLNGQRPQTAEIFPAENGMMLIHIFDDTHDAEYTVSPFDQKGTDSDGKAVDLSDVPLG